MAWDPLLVKYIRETTAATQWLRMRIQMIISADPTSNHRRRIARAVETLRKIRAKLNDAVHRESKQALLEASDLGTEFERIADRLLNDDGVKYGASRWSEEREGSVPPNFRRETKNQVDELVKDLEGFPKWAAKQED